MSAEANPIFCDAAEIVRSAEINVIHKKSPAELRRDAFRQDQLELSKIISTVDPESESVQPLCNSADRQHHFFGPDGETVAERNKRERIAVAICMICPIRESCLETSLKEQYPFGVWGGLGEKDRTKILKKSKVAPKSLSFDT